MKDLAEIPVPHIILQLVSMLMEPVIESGRLAAEMLGGVDQACTGVMIFLPRIAPLTSGRSFSFSMIVAGAVTLIPKNDSEL